MCWTHARCPDTMRNAPLMCWTHARCPDSKQQAPHSSHAGAKYPTLWHTPVCLTNYYNGKNTACILSHKPQILTHVNTYASHTNIYIHINIYIYTHINIYIYSRPLCIRSCFCHWKWLYYCIALLTLSLQSLCHQLQDGG